MYAAARVCLGRAVRGTLRDANGPTSRHQLGNELVAPLRGETRVARAPATPVDHDVPTIAGALDISHGGSRTGGNGKVIF